MCWVQNRRNFWKILNRLGDRRKWILLFLTVHFTVYTIFEKKLSFQYINSYKTGKIKILELCFFLYAVKIQDNPTI